MVVPLKWNTLDQAAKWLSEKTKEVWTLERMIDFSIDRCRPDDTVEDYKFPTYIRTTIPESIADCLTSVALRQNNLEENYVRGEIELKDKKIGTTFVFKDNLIALVSEGKTSISYISYDRDEPVSTQLPNHEATTVAVYCELREMFISLDDPHREFPSIPIIHINFETIGIRDKELKQLLSDYFALPDKVKIDANKKESTRSTENLCRAIACLAIDGYGYKPEDSKSAVSRELSEMMLEKFGFSISDKTIRGWIKKGINLIEVNPHKT